MYPINQIIAGWLSLLFCAVPEPDYMGHWMAQTMRSDVLPYTPGI
ncbi:hypothetical protein C7416_104452 [Cupriavidus phytorum]|uniref:Uncharacterized protein n=1 Tax=Cupriavidus phytorum TaxID=3024399 RepID=A0A2W7PB12_9BURK|nr:hypothetical protein [Cupriavidus alkaliphilus]PZX29447.1 hypothetical protein C7416_104452 [Cupriavidus alkaliphilus]